MLSRNLDDLYFSQSALVAYQNCPLKFRRRYLDGLFWPADWGGDADQRKAVELGNIFHLLAQRYFFRGEIGRGDSELVNNWFARLREFRPYNQSGRFLPEHELRLNEAGIRLVAKYDLLYITPRGKIIIYDWKTNTTLPKINYWRKHLQTIVYRYVLSKVGGVYSPQGVVHPDDVTMIYWNPRYPGVIEPLSYNYNEFLRDEAFLQDLISVIKDKDYEEFMATGDQKRCAYCEYCPICHGKRAVQLELGEEDMDFDLDWENIDEIQF